MILHRKLQFYVIISIYIFILFSTAFPQTLPYYNYSKKDGLAQSGVYNIIQDKTGFMWFTTQDGLSRFDGYTFLTFHNTDGLNENNLRGLGISEDSSIYIATYIKGINIFKNNKFVNYELKNFKDIYIFDFFYFNDTIIVSTSKGYQLIHNNLALPLFNDSSSPDFKKIYNTYGEFYRNSDNDLLFINPYGLFKVKNGQANKINILNFNDSGIYGIAEDKNKNLWLGTNGKIYQVKDYKVIRTIELNGESKGQVGPLFADSNGDIWFYVSKKGLFCFMDNMIVDVGEKSQLENDEVICFYEDNQKNIWVGTQGKGVYCFYNDFIMNYNKSDGLSNNTINSICSLKDGGCLIGTYNGFNLFKNGKIERIPTINENDPENYIVTIRNSYGNSYTATLSNRMKEPIVIPRLYKGLQIYFMPGLGGCQIDSNQFVWGGSNNKLYFKEIFKEEIIDTILIKGDSAYHNWVLDIMPDGKNSMFIATEKGLVRIKYKNRRTYDKDTVLSNFISKIIQTGNNQFIAAGNKGIAVLNNEEVTNTFTTGLNYDFTMSLTVAIDSYKNIWIGTLRAIYIVPLDSLLYNKTGSIIKLDESTGPALDGANDIVYNKASNCIYTGSSGGISLINLNRLKEFYSVPQKVNFIKLELNDTTLYCNQEINLNYNQNNFILHFTSFNYKAPNSITFEYQIENGQHWTETKMNRINFSSLSPGDYKLAIRARDISKINSEISELKFTILAPFWKTLPFYILLSFIFILLVLFVSYKRISFIKKKAKENLDIQKNISSLRHQALSASMNPHFIFNTLNSIQYYINEHDKEEANNYLVNFSRLIRMNLDLAGNTFILLSKEIERLKLYMKYEKLRFEDRLEYRINIDENIETYQLEIPNMILQPFVENSIWHGLSNREDRGIIEINISKKEKVISGINYPVIDIEITDNGIGLEESKKFKKSKHISKGVSIIKDRLNLLAPEIKNFDFVTIKDRTDGIQGVVVNITLLPTQYNIII
jgi:ligand-binding sensor domain-containing protein